MSERMLGLPAGWFIEGSQCNEMVRTLVRTEERTQFRKYAAILDDPETPAVGLEVIINDSRAVPFFESLLRELRIPGLVVVKPWKGAP